jgi:hypothetical protein
MRHDAMIVFWTHNDQRDERFLSTDIVVCSRGFRVSESDSHVYIHGHRRKQVRPAALFDDSTTPWTFVGPTKQILTARYFASKHPSFPRMMIAPTGEIVDLDGNVIMEGPKQP